MSDYQPIATAPKDREILAWWPIQDGHWCTTRWDDEEFCSKPKPHWRPYGLAWCQKTTIRRCQPTHWREKLPPPER